ncbi:MAG: ABC transporter permease [Acidobacteriota bacterium]
MLDFDRWQEIAQTLTRNKLRTALTAFGVFWGIFMLMAMLGAGRGLEKGTRASFAGTATNSFFLWAEATSKPYRGLPSGRDLRMTVDDAAALRLRLTDAEVVAPRVQIGGHRGGATVSRNGEVGSFSVMGDYPEIARIQSLRVERGRFLNAIDLEQARKVAIIGERVRNELFEPDEEPLGGRITIQGVEFRVVGVFDVVAQGDEADQQLRTVFVPFTSFQRSFQGGGRVHWFAVTSKPGVPASRVEEQAKTILRERHRVAPDDRRAFGSFNLEERFQQVQGLLGGIAALVWIVGVGTLAAGVIGVSNIMTIVVKERTQEIGIRRAVGARPASIVSQVLLESVLLTGVSGILGLMAGAWVMEALSAAVSAGGGDGPAMFRDPGVNLRDALVALVVLVGSGMLAGFLPARRALSIHPVQALHAD